MTTNSKRAALHTARRLAITGLLLVCSSAAPGTALSPDKTPDQFARTWWTRVDGLPQSAVQALGRSDPGYLWMGTQEGLARFNGNEFLAFRSETTPAMRSDFVTSLADAGGERLWVGTRQGLLLYEQRRFRRLGASEGLENEYVRALAVAPGDTEKVWIGTSGGGLFVSVDGTSIARVEGVESPVVRALIADAADSLWVGGALGLERVVGDVAVAFPRQDYFQGRSVRALEIDPQGGLWVGFEDGGLVRWSPDGVEEVKIDAGGIAALLIDRHGSLWVAAARSVSRRRPDGIWDSLTDIEPQAAPGYSLFEDRGGSVWVGSRNGLLRLGDGSVTVFGRRQGLADSFVRVVSEDAAGRLWVGSSQGLAVRASDETEFTAHALPGRHVETRALFAEGSAVWVGTRNGLLQARWRESREIQTIEWQEVRFVDSTVDVVLRDGEGRLWAGLQGDGLRYAPPGREFTGPWLDVLADQDRQHRVVRDLLWQPASGDRQDRLWIATEAGLLYWQDGQVAEFALTAPDAWQQSGQSSADVGRPVVLALHLSSDGVLWIGTSAHGIARIDGERQDWFNHHHGLFDNLVFRIVEDAAGNFWMTCNRGVFVVAKANLEAVAEGAEAQLAARWFDETDGLLDAECNGGTQPAGWLDRQQQLWVPTVDGVGRIAVTEVEGVEPDLGPVWIEEVRLNREPLEARAGRYTIPPGTRNVEIQYAAAGHLSSAQSRFEYRLLGFDDEWQQAGTRRTAFFTNLPPGDFTFEVRSVSRFGTPRAAEPIHIVARPTLTERRSFWIALAGLAVLLGVLIALWRLRALREQRLRLEELVQRRTQELAVAMQDLERLATHDALTGLANPRRLHEHLASEWSRAQRSGQPISCLMIDIDYFKQVNDQLGHAAGDRLLVEVSEALRGCVRREGELLSRRSGDEFVVVLPGTEVADAVVVAESMRAAVKGAVHRLIAKEGWPPGLAASVSIGVACTRAHHEQPPTHVLDLADQAVYRAKWEGRDRVST